VPYFLDPFISSGASWLFPQLGYCEYHCNNHWCAGACGVTCLSFLWVPCTSINLKWIKDLNIRPETLKLLQEGAGITLEQIGLGKDFLDRTPAAPQLRQRMNKWDFIKFKSFCTTKEMVYKLKRPPTEWEKIFASYTSDKGLITRICRN
jgi:hypothetical protein